ncbi:MAG TPA: hypothetical protein VFH56_00535 [Acidimicrobiales bacterium]|nr:hypothetical protein [Acidimicrobiales bacterium]
MDPTTHARATNGIGRLWHRSRPNRRSLGAAGVAVAVIAVFMQSGPLAGAASTGTFKNYNVHVAPGAVLASNSQTSVTVNLQNEITSNTSFGSVALTITNLDDAAIDTPSLPNGWSVSNTPPPGVTVLLVSKKSVSIAPGATLPLVLDITPSTAGTITIGTEVKQSNDFSGTGNDFNYDSANSNPTVQVVTSVLIQFKPGPPSYVVQSSPICPAIAVLVTAPDGSTPVSGVPVTVSNGGTSSVAGGDPGLYYQGSALTGATPPVTSRTDGLATFGTCQSGLSATKLGSGFTLSASTTVTSNSPQSSSVFAVVQAFESCSPSSCPPVTVTSGTDNVSGTIHASFTANGQLLGTFGEGTLQCDGGVVDLTKVTADPIVAQAFTSPNSSSGTITMTFPKAVVNNLANNGTPLMQVCAGANNPFTTVDGTMTLSCTPSTDPNVGPCNKKYEGLLPNCASGYQNVVGINPADNSILLCVVSRSKNAANETIVIYASDLSDPWSF